LTMLSWECQRKYQVFKRASEEIGKIRVAIATEKITDGVMMSRVGQVLLELDHAKKEGLITDEEYNEVRSAGLNELRDAPSVSLDLITIGRASEIENRVFQIALEKLVECECDKRG
jgi:hypothetical protein